MKVKLHQDVEGAKSGDSIDVPADRAKFLIQEGYASTSKDVDGVTITSVPADIDPTLAENREEPQPHVQDRFDAVKFEDAKPVDESKAEEIPEVTNDPQTVPSNEAAPTK